LLIFEQKTGPLPTLVNLRAFQDPEYMETPFKQYPLPSSPFKSISVNLFTTPSHRQSPLTPFRNLKSILGENDIFAISPGMFPRKTKRLDYLDIFHDSERKDFMSPIKTYTTNEIQPEMSTDPIEVNQKEGEDVGEYVAVDIDVNVDMVEQVVNGI
jgi:hypothetical protein